MSHPLFEENTPIAIVASFILVILLSWRLKPSMFRALSWQAVGIACALFWGVFAALMVAFAWGFYYKLFVPSWYRLVAPIGAVVLYSSLGILFRWISLRLPGQPTIWFCLLGGLESIPEHAIGIYRIDILNLPILAGSMALGIFIFAFFEYVIYWVIALSLAYGINRCLQMLKLHASGVPGMRNRTSG